MKRKLGVDCDIDKNNDKRYSIIVIAKESVYNQAAQTVSGKARASSSLY